MSTTWTEISAPEVLATKPLVSVKMITYNHEAFIAQAIEGVIMQKTTFPLELIIGVDCSTDNTLEVALRYQKLYPDRVRVFYPEARAGAKANSRQTLQACRGKYIAMCEGDDYWTHPEKLAMQVEFLEKHSEIAGTFHDCFIIDQKNGSKKLRVGDRSIDQEPDVASLIRENNIPTGSMVFRNVIPVAQWGEWMSKTAKGDYMLALLVAQHGLWHYTKPPMSVYRVHDGGIWSGISVAERSIHNVAFWEMLENSGDFSDVVDIIRARRRDDVRGLGIALAREGRLFASSRAYLRSLGSKRALQRKFISSSKYFMACARTLLTRLGLLDVVKSLRGKLLHRQ